MNTWRCVYECPKCEGVDVKVHEIRSRLRIMATSLADTPMYTDCCTVRARHLGDVSANVSYGRALEFKDRFEPDEPSRFLEGVHVGDPT